MKLNRIILKFYLSKDYHFSDIVSFTNEKSPVNSLFTGLKSGALNPD